MPPEPEICNHALRCIRDIALDRSKRSLTHRFASAVKLVRAASWGFSEKHLLD